jgi:hypothetical protein
MKLEHSEPDAHVVTPEVHGLPAGVGVTVTGTSG